METIPRGDSEEMIPSKWNRFSQLASNCRKPFQTKYHPRPDKPESFRHSLKYAFLCPPHGELARYLSYIISLALLWLVCLAISPQQALPGSNVFSLIVLYTAAALAGKLVTILRLPSMVGMFLVGVLVRNVPHINIAQHILPHWTSCLRNFALTILLLRTGFKIMSIRRGSSNIFYRLHSLPFAVELFTSACMYRFITKLPWSWSISLGSIISSVSPSIILTLLLQIQNLRHTNSIQSQIAAALIVNNIFAAVIVAITWSTENNAANIILKLLEPFGEILVGVIVGILLCYIPPEDFVHNLFFRCVFLVGSSALVLFTLSAVHQTFVGHLAVLVLSYVAAWGWKKGLKTNQMLLHKVDAILNTLWLFCQTLLFGLMGCDVNLSVINARILGFVFVCLFTGLLVRFVISYVVMVRTQITKRERVYCSLALLPKAESQVLAAYILQNALDLGDEILQPYGYIVLKMTVLAILLTAPFGATLLHLSGRYLLKTPTESNDESNIALVTRRKSSEDSVESLNGDDVTSEAEQQFMDISL
ncbi:sodium/hydrogen exchanger 9B2 isoform X1 [Octopus bimaculoides]|nr:sodium/hydrogen exchanger 9B2 isoform X1 [Octopus bimaculoides]|eukprot:XP_014780639.1 PREDICTED: mitochondrial sodium/hydrogen exchanger 9B2-like isoform X1 [Octopus bimaculoides]